MTLNKRELWHITKLTMSSSTEVRHLRVEKDLRKPQIKNSYEGYSIK